MPGSKQDKPKQKKPKTDWRRVFVTVLALLMALLMILPMIASVFTSSASAATTAELQEQINQSKSESADLKAQIKELNAQLKEIEGDKSQALQQKKLLDQQVSAKEREISNTENIIAQYDSLIVEKEAEVVVTKEKEAQQYELFCRRARSMEEAGTVSYWSILFSASDFSDLLDRATFVSEVMEYDNALMDQLAATRLQLEQQQADLEGARADQQAQRDTLVAQKADLDVDLAAAVSLVRQIQSQENEYAAARDALEKEEEATRAEMVKKQKQLQAQLDAGKIKFEVSGNWAWPLPGRYTITSTFGPRIHPITGRSGNHTGTDIAAPRGTAIQCAANGVVTISAYNNSYGNYVVVQHQNGIATLYAHMSSRSVSEGQVVSQGQTLGLVGSTGSSTGNHLHLEFRLNGGRQDALNYYPSLSGKFVYR